MDFDEYKFIEGRLLGKEFTRHGAKFNDTALLCFIKCDCFVSFGILVTVRTVGGWGGRFLPMKLTKWKHLTPEET